MRIALLLLLSFGGAVMAAAQTPPVGPPTSAPSATALGSAATPGNVTDLDVTDAERQYFELGDVLAQAAFTYYPLASQADRFTHLPRSREKEADAMLTQTAKLAPSALRARAQASRLFSRAVTLMQELNAPDKPLSPIRQLSAHLKKPLTPTGDAQAVAAWNPDAGTVLAALDESDRLSGVLDNKALQDWATGASSDQTGRVWYAEGLMAGVTQAAASLGQIDLLPPSADLATDLRGLRDWLSLRMPETPTPDQIALQTNIDMFMAKTADSRHRPKALTLAQVQDLSAISRLLEAQILPPDSPIIAPVKVQATALSPGPITPHKASTAPPLASQSEESQQHPQGLL